MVVPRANERARSKAEGRTQHVLKPDISKRPSVIGTTKSTESTSPTSSSAKPKNRKPSFKTSDTFPESLSASDSSNLLGSQHLMKSVVSTPFPFYSQLPIRKPDTPSIGQAVSNGVSNPVLPKSNAAVTQAESSKEIWKSPPTQTTAKKSDKNEEAVNATKTVSISETKNSEAKNSEAKNSNKSSSNITKKRKNNKASSADEDGKKKQKTNSNHEKKSSYSLGAIAKGKGKTPILPPSPFVSKSSSSSSVREM